MRLARQAALFHDIGRFYEVENMYCRPQQPNNHARYGYDFLRQYPEYNDLRILLPVKHHSSMIEKLYEDYEFTNVEDPQRKFEIEKITFWFGMPIKLPTSDYWLMLTEIFAGCSYKN